MADRKTIITDSPSEAAEFIRTGGIVAFPTETVYGLGANVFDADAIARIFEAKGRPADNPLIVHIAQITAVEELVDDVTETARRFMQAFFPGPLTLVLKRSEKVPLIATAGLDSVGVRMPGSKIAVEFLRECSVPVAAPSANLSGRPSPTTWDAVLNDLDGRIDAILRGEMTEIGLESTVVDCTSDVPLVLRPGAVSIDQLREVVPETALFFESQITKARSPGMKHKHYAPAATVKMVYRDDEISVGENSAFIGLHRRDGNFRLQKNCQSTEEYAHELFAFFRDCDYAGVRMVYCERVDETGMGAALMDRIRRAEAR